LVQQWKKTQLNKTSDDGFISTYTLFAESSILQQLCFNFKLKNMPPILSQLLRSQHKT